MRNDPEPLKDILVLLLGYTIGLGFIGFFINLLTGSYRVIGLSHEFYMKRALRSRSRCDRSVLRTSS